MTVRSCTKSEKRISKQTKICDGCKKPGSLVKCDITSCEATTHIYCALRGMVEFTQKKDEPPKTWSYKLSNQENPVKVTLDLEDTMLKESLESEYVKLEKIAKKLSGDVEEQEPEPEPENDNKNSSAKKKKGNRRNTKEEEPEATKMLNEEDEAAIIGINEEIKDKLKEYIKALPQGNSPRGGEIVLQCKSHKMEDLYCICNLPYDNGRAMFGCDCCSKGNFFI